MSSLIVPNIHELPDGRELEYGIVSPKNPTSPETGANIVYFLPHGMTLESLLHTTLAEQTRDRINPSANLILLPNINFGNNPYTLTKSDRKKVDQGDLSPIAKLDASLLRSLGNLSATTLIGPSFGGARGAKALSQLEAGENVRGAVLLGAPNVVPRNERGPIRLRVLFSSQAKNIRPFAAASEVPQEVLDHEGLDSGLLDSLKFAGKLAIYSFGGNVLPTNHALNQFFLRGTFFDDVTEASAANPETPIIVGTSFNDPVSPYLKFCNFVLSGRLPGNVTFKSYRGNHLTHSSPKIIAELAQKLYLTH